MVRTLGRVLSRLSEEYMPNPLIFAIILTLVAYLMGVVVAQNTFMEMLGHWYTGFWSLLTFAMQMVLILVTGHALAVAPGVRDLIRNLAGRPNNNAQAAALTALVAGVFAWINWGLGLIVGALFALEVARQAHARGVKVHYPIVAAAGYSGQMVWHWGLSSSAGLLVATEGHFLQDMIGIVPLTQTVFSSYALINSAILVLLVVPLIFYLMAPRKEESVGIEGYAPELLAQDETAATQLEARERVTFADRLENSRLLSGLVALMAVVYIIRYFLDHGFDLNLNIVNFVFLAAGVILHQTPIRYMKAIQDAIGGASGIVLQFPFYGGIMGMIRYSGLGEIIANWFLNFATPFTYPAIVWLTGGFMNLFVPSGGGEWAVIGPILSKVSLELGVPIGKTIIAYGAGDMWTNMFQPFWAIALLGITRLRARDIIGYTTTLLILAAPVFLLGLLFIPY